MDIGVCGWVLLGLRWTNAFLFVPITVVCLGAVIFVTGHPTASDFLLAYILPEAGYLGGLVLLAVSWSFLRWVYEKRLPNTLMTVRTAIAWELDSVVEPPKEMPPKLGRLVAQLQIA